MESELLPHFGATSAALHGAVLALAVLPLFVGVPVGPNIVVTAAATVFVGCWRSVKPEPPAESMTRKDAAKFPLVGSAVLFSLFLAFKFLPKDLVNTVLSVYFVVLGLLALTATLEPLLAPFVPEPMTRSHRWLRIRSLPYILQDGLDVDFSYLELVLAAVSALFCVYYWTSRHWLASNVLGISFSVQGIEHLSLGSTSIGVLLLCGLFFYDVFWVFFTPVMVAVARSFDAPIKLLFPRAGELDASGNPRFSMLGLGDIVIPGVFVALVLRYDAVHSGRPRFFLSAAVGYVVGLAATILAMNVFEAAQPALLYLVPSILIATFGTALAAGEARALFTWHEQEGRAVDDADSAPVEAVAAKNKDD